MDNPDISQSSLELVDQTARKRLAVKEDAYTSYIEEELSLSANKARKSSKLDSGSTGRWAIGAGIGARASVTALDRQVECFSDQPEYFFKNENRSSRASR